MKKISIILVALSFLMTLTQCKKKDLHIVNDAVYITLDVNNGSRIDVNTTTGAVRFGKYDVIYAVSDGKFVGTLEHNGERFSGSIEGAVEGEPLFFYFFGNKRPDYLKVGESTSCSVVIDDQTDKLPVISCGLSNEEFSSETNIYSVFLRNRCALVKFNVSTISEDEATCISGLNNKVEIDFSTCTFKYSQAKNGVIKLKPGSGERWAILLPNDEAIDEGAIGTVFSADYRYFGSRPAMDAIYNNDYIAYGYDISIETAAEGDGKFSMNGSKRVIFAKGNVQYIAAKGTEKACWKFADNQYDMLPNTAEQTGDGVNINRDRFGWGTGDNPNNVSTRNADYFDYVDWGKNFPNDEGFDWHAPKCIEWEYVMFTRNASKLNGVYNARYARARIDTPEGDRINGLILFPDVYNHPGDVELPKKASINYTTDNNGGAYTDNIYSVEDWEKMELAGAVFLPAGGQRIVKSGSLGFYDVNVEGHYWSQCDLDDPEHACNIYFTTYRPYIYDKNDKYKGFSVRLVHE